MAKSNVAVFAVLNKGAAPALAGKAICELPGCEYGALKTIFYDLSRGRSAPQATVDKSASLLKQKLDECLGGLMFDRQVMSKQWREDIEKRGYIVERLI